VIEPIINRNIRSEKGRFCWTWKIEKRGGQKEKP